MFGNLAILFAASESNILYWVLGGAGTLALGGLILLVLFNYGGLWFQAYMTSANVSLCSLIAMGFRRVNSRLIVQGKIMSLQAGIGSEDETSITTRRLEAHYLAGGNVLAVVRSLIAAHRADIDLDFDRAAAIDLAGRDVLDAVQTSVYPKVIDCPDPKRSTRTTLERDRQERRGAEGSRPGDGAHERRAAYRRRDRGDDHRPGRRRHHHGDRFVEEPSGSDGASGQDLEGGARPRTGRADGVRDRVDRHRRHRGGREHRRPLAGRSGRGRHPRRPREGRGTPRVGAWPASRK